MWISPCSGSRWRSEKNSPKIFSASANSGANGSGQRTTFGFPSAMGETSADLSAREYTLGHESGGRGEEQPAPQRRGGTPALRRGRPHHVLAEVRRERLRLEAREIALRRIQRDRERQGRDGLAGGVEDR